MTTVKINGTEPFARVRLHVKNKVRPKGWFEVYNLGIRADQAREWADKQITRWNMDNPTQPRELVRVQVFRIKRWAPAPRAKVEAFNP